MPGSNNPSPIATPVWDGDRCLGHLIHRRCGHVEAVPINGDSAGFFNHENAALAALIGADRGPQAAGRDQLMRTDRGA